jgi:hypothetical protein
MVKFGEASAQLNDTINRRSNNSFNRSGMSLHVIRQLGCYSQILPARLIRALGAYIFLNVWTLK